MKKAIILAVGVLLSGAALGQTGNPPVTGAKVLSPADSLLMRQWFFSGLREKTIQNYPLAADMFRRVVELDPGNDVALYELAGIHNAQNENDKAERYIKAATTLKPQNEWYWLLLADIYKRTNNLPALVTVFDELIRVNPDNEDVYFDKANALLRQNNATEASAVFDEIEERFGESDDLSSSRQRVLLAQGKPEKAIAELEKQIGQKPGDLRSYLMLGELYMDAGETDKALNTLKKARSLEPANALVRLSLADVYRSMNKPEDAFIELKEAFADVNLHIDEKVRIVLSFFPSFSDIRARAQADELASVLTKVHADDPKSHAVYGDVLFQEQKFTEARAAYKKALSLNDQVYLIWEQLLRIEVSEGDFKQAMADGETALSIFPNQAPLYLYTGIAYAQLQKHEKAISYLKNALTLETEDRQALSQIWSALGDSFNALKRYKESDQAYEKALENDPDNSYTLNNYAYYLSLRGENLEKAERMSRRSNELDPGNASFEDTFAWILFKMKKYREARTWIEKAISNDKDNSSTQIEHYGDILYHLGEEALAVGQWKKALQAGAKSELLQKKINEKKYFD